MVLDFVWMQSKRRCCWPRQLQFMLPWSLYQMCACQILSAHISAFCPVSFFFNSRCPSFGTAPGLFHILQLYQPQLWNPRFAMNKRHVNCSERQWMWKGPQRIKRKRACHGRGGLGGTSRDESNCLQFVNHESIRFDDWFDQRGHVSWFCNGKTR